MAFMSELIIIDGNNMLYAMHEHAPVPAVGRAVMIKAIAGWAKRTNSSATIVFDGREPPGGLSREEPAKHIRIEFASPETADDIIIRMIRKLKHPGATRVISTDNAIRYEARRNKCSWNTSAEFVEEIFSPPPPKDTLPAPHTAEDQNIEKQRIDTEEWLEFFGLDEKEVAKEEAPDLSTKPDKPPDLPVNAQAADWIGIFEEAMRKEELRKYVQPEGSLPAKFLEDEHKEGKKNVHEMLDEAMFGESDDSSNDEQELQEGGITPSPSMLEKPTHSPNHGSGEDVDGWIKFFGMDESDSQDEAGEDENRARS